MAIDVARFTDTDEPAPPREFRIFRKGWNGAEADPDRVLFDEKAAAAVMAAYEKHGVLRMIDLEHNSLDDESPAYDPDARGWCKLELREGELWAVDVDWTDEGAERIRSKKQRYISPAFTYNAKTRRVEKIFNIALTAMPATHWAQDLLAAASVRDLRKFSTGPSLNELQIALAAALRDKHPALEMGGPWVCDIFDASVVYEYDGKIYEAPYSMAGSSVTLGAPVEVRRTYEPITAPPAPAAAQRARYAADGAPMAEIDTKAIAQTCTDCAAACTACAEAIASGDIATAMAAIQACMDACKACEAACGQVTGSAPPSSESSAEGEPPTDETAAMRAALPRLRKATSKFNLSEIVETVETTMADVQQLTQDRAALEAIRRASLFEEIAKFSGPAFAWENPLDAADRTKRKEAEPFASMTTDAVGRYVAKLKATPRIHGVQPPRREDEQPPPAPKHDLTPEQLKLCAEYGVTPEEYAALRNRPAR